MNFDFELILFYATLVTGLIGLADVLFFARKRKAEAPSWAIEYARSFFPVLLIVFLLRSFFFEPFRIPSGSLQPTLLIGDFIALNKYHYGIRLPVWHQKIIKIKDPERGDIMVFRWPANPAYYFIKRVIGLPGDHISYINKELTINGQKINQVFQKNTTSADENGNEEAVVQSREQLLNVLHDIYTTQSRPGHDFKDIIVPQGMYFVMGDNRDNSADSRYFGFVPDQNIVGKAEFVWMSWDRVAKRVRWHRIGHAID